MKNYILVSLLSIYILTSCFSQQLVKKQEDARLIIQQKERFINKPLKDLIKEIKPEIKNALAMMLAPVEGPHISDLSLSQKNNPIVLGQKICLQK
jgi:hypothetical protein